MAAHQIDLQTPLRKNMPEGSDSSAVARLMRIRRAMETAIGKLSERFAAQTTKARDLPGFVNRWPESSSPTTSLSWLLHHDRSETRESGIGIGSGYV